MFSRNNQHSSFVDYRLVSVLVAVASWALLGVISIEYTDDLDASIIGAVGGCVASIPFGITFWFLPMVMVYCGTVILVAFSAAAGAIGSAILHAKNIETHLNVVNATKAGAIGGVAIELIIFISIIVLLFLASLASFFIDGIGSIHERRSEKKNKAEKDDYIHSNALAIVDTFKITQGIIVGTSMCHSGDIPTLIINVLPLIRTNTSILLPNPQTHRILAQQLDAMFIVPTFPETVTHLVDRFEDEIKNDHLPPEDLILTEITSFPGTYQEHGKYFEGRTYEEALSKINRYNKLLSSKRYNLRIKLTLTELTRFKLEVSYVVSDLESDDIIGRINSEIYVVLAYYTDDISRESETPFDREPTSGSVYRVNWNISKGPFDRAIKISPGVSEKL
ncbi:hypothetical protein BDQ17DRAFT_1332393 [Cyathus striatus]|nr:hypothetical protein BDQ17DRAFT_1332393 [Cyathus striatus]